MRASAWRPLTLRDVEVAYTLERTVRRRLYHLVRRFLTQERRNRLKRQVFQARMKLAPLYRLRHGTFDAADLQRELAGRLPDDAEIVMVHCSLNDLRPTYVGDANELVNALVD